MDSEVLFVETSWGREWQHQGAAIYFLLASHFPCASSPACARGPCSPPAHRPRTGDTASCGVTLPKPRRRQDFSFSFLFTAVSGPCCWPLQRSKTAFKATGSLLCQFCLRDGGVLPHRTLDHGCWWPLGWGCTGSCPAMAHPVEQLGEQWTPQASGLIQTQSLHTTIRFRLDGALSNLVYLKTFLLTAVGGWDRWPLKVPSNPKRSMILTITVNPISQTTPKRACRTAWLHCPKLLCQMASLQLEGGRDGEQLSQSSLKMPLWGIILERIYWESWMMFEVEQTALQEQLSFAKAFV